MIDLPTALAAVAGPLSMVVAGGFLYYCATRIARRDRRGPALRPHASGHAD